MLIYKSSDGVGEEHHNQNGDDNRQSHDPSSKWNAIAHTQCCQNGIYRKDQVDDCNLNDHFGHGYLDTGLKGVFRFCFNFFKDFFGAFVEEKQTTQKKDHRLTGNLCTHKITLQFEPGGLHTHQNRYPQQKNQPEYHGH